MFASLKTFLYDEQMSYGPFGKASYGQCPDYIPCKYPGYPEFTYWDTEWCVPAYNQGNKTPWDGSIRPYALPYTCFNHPLTHTVQSAIISSGAIKCPEFPSWDPLVPPVVYDVSKAPFRVALDERAVVNFDNIFVGVVITNTASKFLDQDCSVLNGAYPGCSSTGGNSCQWDLTVIPTDCGFIGDALIGNNAQTCFDGTFLNASTQFAGSFCQKRRADTAFRKNCCLQKLHLPSGNGFSQSVWIKDRLWSSSNTIITDLFSNQSTEVMQSVSEASHSYNPYTVYCDPRWCPTSNDCDDVVYEECLYSTTGDPLHPIHACLAPSGLCRDWYLDGAGEAGLVSTTHSWNLYNSLITEYCLHSASALGDTQSCQCVAPGNATTYYGSCSQFGTVCNAVGDNGVRGIVAVDSASTNSPNIQVLEDFVCGNPFCMQARYGSVSFITSQLLERSIACPNNVCILIDLGRSISINEITSGSAFWIIGSNDFNCSQNVLPPGSVDFTFETFTNIWNWDVTTREILNPFSTGKLGIRNGSSSSAITLTHSPFPSWISLGGVTTSTLAPFQNYIAEFNFIDRGFTGAEYAPVQVTISSGDVRKVANVVFLIREWNSIQPKPIPSGPPENPSGIPMIVSEAMSPGAFALIAIGIMLLLGTFWMAFSRIQ